MFNPKEIIMTADLSPEKFDKLLEYLYWERKQELELERLKIERGCYDKVQKHGGKQTKRSATNNAAAAQFSPDEDDLDDDDDDEDQTPATSNRVAAYTKEDREFNAATSYGLLGESFVGKLAKTKLWSASKSKAESIFRDNKVVIKERFRSMNRESKAKTLIHYILWGSAIAQRADRWPHAKDIEFLVPAKDDIDLKLVGFTDEQIATAVQFLQERWGAICSFPDLHINTTLIASRLDAAHEKIVVEEKHREEFDVLKAPYVLKMLEYYPYIDHEGMKNRIIANRYDYRSSFRWNVMQDFKKTPPPFITPDPKYPWLQQVPQYLTPYKQELEKRVAEVWEETRAEQQEWDRKRVEALG